MPVGEFIAELTLRFVFEFVICGAGYGTGWIILKLITLGRLRIAPLSTFEQRNRGQSKWKWGVWLHRPMQPRALRAEVACLIGILAWFAAGIGMYLASR